MHTEGQAYKDSLINMYFLEDDFNDNLYHFCAANERYRINSGLIREKIIDLKKKVRGSRLYDFDSYTGYSK
ncbi:MAG: hypothetical protein J5I98_04775 [Phaeodactylibacter sp.]|nr:hypothetical protein [Phaeodactylibacter sp.]